MDASRLDASEKQFNERVKQTIVARMSLATMFPDPQVRSLAKAAGKGDLKEVRKLVQQGVDVNARGTSNAIPLYWALKNYKGFEELLKLGADPNVVFDDGGNVIHHAMDLKDLRFFRAALVHGGNPNIVAGMLNRAPIFEIDGNVEKLKILLQQGADINTRSQFPHPLTDEPMLDTPLIAAAREQKFDSVGLLLQYGADPYLTNYKGDNLQKVLESKKQRFIPNSEEDQEVDKLLELLQRHSNQAR